MHADVTRDKQALRSEMARRRSAEFHAPDRDRRIMQATRHLTKLLHTQFGADLRDLVLAGYMPMRTEIDPLPAMAGHTGPVCVPVIPGKDMALEFHRWTPATTMIEGGFKALIPAQRDLLVPKALIVPLLAFDRGGFRLGYGGGFYDRTLAALRGEGKVFAVGFAFAAQEIDAVPVNATDQVLDAIVTPDGARVLRAAADL